MTATLEFARPGAGAGRAAFVPLAAREMRRFVLNPVFLFAVVMTEWTTWTGGGGTITEIDNVNGYPAIFLGGFGMMATYWLTRSMRASEPVVGVTPTTRPTRTAALCWVAIVPFFCGCPDPVRVPALLPGRRRGVRAVQPVSAARRPGRADRRPVPRRPAARCRAGPLGAVPGRRVRAVPGHLRLGGAGDDPDPVASGLGAHRGAAAVLAVRLLHGPRATPATSRLARVAVVLHRLAARPVRDRGPGGAAARGRGAGALPDHPCPRDRGSDGRDPARAGRHAAGSPTPSPRDGRTGAAGRGVAGGRGHQRRGGRGGRLRGRVPGRRHRAAPGLLRAARRGRGVHPGRAGQPGRRRDADRARPAHRDPRRGVAGAARRRRAGAAGGGPARTGAALGGGRPRAGRQRAARIRRGVRGPDPDRRTGRGGRRRRRAGADGARPRAAGRALGPHVPGARRRRPVLGSRVVDRPRGVRGGHRHLDRWPQAAPVDVQGDLPAVVDSLRHQLGGQFAALQHDVSACAPRRWPRAR